MHPSNKTNTHVDKTSNTAKKHEKTTGGKSCIHQIKPIMQDAQKEVNDQ